MRATWLVMGVLLACMLQTTEALTAFFPDDCATVSGGASNEDDCQSACARCVCCARRVSSLVAIGTDLPFAAVRVLITAAETRIPTASPPRDVFHVPRSVPLS